MICLIIFSRQIRRLKHLHPLRSVDFFHFTRQMRSYASNSMVVYEETLKAGNQIALCLTPP